MVMNRDLFLAILAMDSYNRGYGAGIKGLDLVKNTTQLGNAIITNDADDQAGIARAAGFYAIAYNWNGETIISYRGTDIAVDTNGIGGDATYGWPIGGGQPYAAQALLAASFFNAVAGTAQGAKPSYELQ